VHLDCRAFHRFPRRVRQRSGSLGGL